MKPVPKEAQTSRSGGPTLWGHGGVSETVCVQVVACTLPSGAQATANPLVDYPREKEGGGLSLEEWRRLQSQLVRKAAWLWAAARSRRSPGARRGEGFWVGYTPSALRILRSGCSTRADSCLHGLDPSGQRGLPKSFESELLLARILCATKWPQQTSGASSISDARAVSAANARKIALARRASLPSSQYHILMLLICIIN